MREKTENKTAGYCPLLSYHDAHFPKREEWEYEKNALVLKSKC
jgi:hypothetical protein